MKSFTLRENNPSHAVPPDSMADGNTPVWTKPDQIDDSQNLPKSSPGQGQSAAMRNRLINQHTLLEAHKQKLEGVSTQSKEYQTGYVVALQTSIIAEEKNELPPPLMLSFSEESLRGARDAAPHLARVLNLSKSKFGNDWLERARALGCVAVDLSLKLVTPERIQQAHQSGFRIMCYTPNDPEMIAKFFPWGIDGVITDMIHAISPDQFQRWDRDGSDVPSAKFSGLAAWPYPELVGHRMAGKTTEDFRLAPENTMAAAVAAFERGYKAVEYDVNISTDPIPVPFVMHDSTLARTTDGEGTVSRPWGELAMLRAGAGVPHFGQQAPEPIPTDLELAGYLVDHRIARFVEIKPTGDD